MNVQQLKKPLLYTTIGLFAASALIGIIVVLTSAYNQVVGQIISTTTLLGLIALFSMNNILRTEDNRTYIRVLSIIALVSNLIWGLPWLLMVWNIITVDYTNAQILWRLIITAIVVSYNMTLSAKFLSFKKYTSLIKGLAIMTIVAAAIISIYLLINLYGSNFTLIAQIFEKTWRVLVISGILLVFGMIVTPILARSELKKDAAPTTAAAPTAPAANEAELRAKIESEVRAQVEAEMREKMASTNSEPTSAESPNQPSEPSEPTPAS